MTEAERTAYLQGRREALEEAARVMDDGVRKKKSKAHNEHFTMRERHDHETMMIAYLHAAGAFRALAAREPEPTEQE